MNKVEQPLSVAVRERLEAAVALGMALHHAGKLEEAAGVYRGVLKEDPKRAEVLTHLGLIHVQRGRLKEAIKLLDDSLTLDPAQPVALNNRGKALHLLKDDEAALASFDGAITLQPRYAQAHYNRGLALHALGRHAEAVASFDEAIKLKPDYAQAFNDRGHALQALNRPGDARKSFRRALALKPDFADGYYNKGNQCMDRLQYREALRNYDRALALEPNNPSTHFNRGNALRKLDRQQDAVKSYDRAIALKPDYAKAYNNRGNALQALKRVDEALANFDRSIALDPLNPRPYNNRGLALQYFRRYDEALANLDKALELEPDRLDALNNRGNLLLIFERFEEALACYERAIEVDPDDARGHWNKGLFLLLHGELEEGFRLYEWRRRNPNLPISKRKFDRPLWLGAEPIRGKTILLHAEQGFGDSVQFARYVERVAALGARIVIEVPAPLIPLLSCLDGVSELVPMGRKLPHDVQTSLASLPFIFKTNLENIPARVPYLSVAAERIAHWRAELGEPRGLRVGLVWSGDPIHKNDHNRSIPLASLLPLTRCGAEIIALQKDPRPADAAVLDDTPEIRNVGPALRDFADTAAALSNLDLLISADTAVAHVAGAIGKPVWILLPRSPDWRWMLDRDDSPWYPTARLFRQTIQGDWRDIVERVAAGLNALASARRQAGP